VPGLSLPFRGKRVARRPRARALASPRRRARLLAEFLEDRCVPATQLFHGLEFVSAVPFTQVGSTYTNSGPIFIGFAPGPSQSFTPLLESVGSIELDDGSDPSFTVNGLVGEVLSGQDNILFDGAQTFDVGELLNGGVSTDSGQSFEVAGASFTLDDIRFTDSPSDGPEVQLQGGIALPGVGGVQVAVDGSNFVNVGESGVVLTGVDASLSGDVEVGGLAFDASQLSVSYIHTASDDTFTITGDTSFSLGGDTVSVAFGGTTPQGTQTQGLVVQDGFLTNLDMAITGSFSLGGLSFHADDLAISYSDSGGYSMAGAADFAVGADTVDVQLGGTTPQGTQTQGLVIQGGTLTNFDMAVSGSFGLGGLSFHADDLTITYAAATPSAPATYTMSGAADFDLGGDSVDVQLGGSTPRGTQTRGLVIQDGSLTSLDMAVTGSFGLGGLSFHADDLTITYAAATPSTPDTFTMSGAADFDLGSDTFDVRFGGATPQGTQTQGLVIQDGTLTRFDMAVTGGFEVGSLQFNADDLTITYAATPSPGTYTVSGAADFALGSDTVDVQFGGTTPKGTQTKGLVIRNGSLTSLDMAVTGSFGLGGLSFHADDLTIAYAAATPSAPDTFTTTGAADFDLDGDTVDVQFGGGSTRGLVIEGGVLTNLDMAVTGSVTISGLSLHADGLTVTYTAATPSVPDTFTIDGAADFSLDGDNVGVQFGGGSTKGLVIQGGTLVELDMAVTGSFTIFGVTLDPQDLTFAYDAALDQFEMSGSLAISTSSQAIGTATGQVFDEVTATLGQGGSPGLIVSNGVLQQLDVSINGSFNLFGLTVAPNDLTVDYNAGDSVLQITGGVTLTDLFGASADLPGGGLTIDTATGAVTLNNLDLDLSDVVLGAFTIEQFQLDYSQGAQGTSVVATLQLDFPGGWGVGGTLGLVDGQIQDISIDYDVTQGEGIPIGATGLFLTSMSATVDNINQPSDLVVGGSITVDFGPHVTVMGQSVAMVQATGSFQVDAAGLTIDGSATVADGLIGSGSARLVADWGSGDYSLSADLSLFDGTFDVSGSFQFDSGGDFLLLANASVNVPDVVPIVGGDQLGDLGFAFKYDDNGGNPTGFVAAWDTISYWIGSTTVGFEYDLDGNFSVLGSGGVSGLQSQLSIQSEPFRPQTATPRDLAVPANAAEVNLQVSTTGNATEDYLLSYPGGQATLADLARAGTRNQFGITTVVSTPSGPIKVTIVQLSPTGATVIIQPAQGGAAAAVPAGVYSLRDRGGNAPSARFSHSFSYNQPTIQAPTFAATNGPSGTVANSFDLAASGWIAPAVAEGATVAFYATPLVSGGARVGNGILIGKATTAAGTLTLDAQGHFVAKATWNLKGFPPNAYHVYAVVFDGQSPPVDSPVSQGSITPVLPISGRVTTPDGSQPVDGVRVELFVNADPSHLPSQPTAVTTTNADGTFGFWAPSSGSFTYVVRVVAQGGYQANANSTVAGTYDGTDPADLSLQVITPATISGTVTDEPSGSGSGTPVAGVKVFIDLNNDSKFDAGDLYAVTDAHGRYRFRNVPVGSYNLIVVPPAGYDLKSAGTQAVTVSDPHGKTTGIDFVLAGRVATAPAATITYPSSQGADVNWLNRVSGHVTADHGSDVSGVEVSVQDEATGLYWDGTSFASHSPVFLDAHGTTAWSLPLPVSALTDGATYEIRSEAIDRAGAIQGTPSIRAFTYTAPQLIIPPVEPTGPTNPPSPPGPPNPTGPTGGQPTGSTGGQPTGPTGGQPTQPAAGTVVNIFSSASPAVVGQPVTLAIQVSPAPGSTGVPTGLVVLRDGATVLAVLPLVNGVATYQATSLTSGVHAYLAIYVGDGAFLPSASVAVVQTVQKVGLQGSPTGQGAATLAIGGAGRGETIAIVAGPAGRRFRLVIRKVGRRVFAQTFATNQLSQLMIYDATGRERISIRGRLPLPVYLQAGQGSKLIHRGAAHPTARSAHGLTARAARRH
jgi:hypothetical protein